MADADAASSHTTTDHQWPDDALRIPGASFLPVFFPLSLSLFFHFFVVVLLFVSLVAFNF